MTLSLLGRNHSPRGAPCTSLVPSVSFQTTKLLRAILGSRACILVEIIRNGNGRFSAAFAIRAPPVSPCPDDISSQPISILFSHLSLQWGLLLPGFQNKVNAKQGESVSDVFYCMNSLQCSTSLVMDAVRHKRS